MLYLYIQQVRIDAMSSSLDTIVLSTAGRLVGRSCSEIPFKLSERVLLKRALLWKWMQEKYEQLEESSLNQDTININRLGDYSVKSLSSSCNEVVPLSTHIKSPGESWEDRRKYRKSKDSIQHWINTSLHDLFNECVDQILPVPSKCQELTSYDSGKEPVHSSPHTKSCVLQHQRNYEEHYTSRDFQDVDIVSGMSKEEDTHDVYSEVLFTTQEQGHTLQKRSAMQSLKDSSKVQNTQSERLTTDRKSSATESHYFISPVSNNRILVPADRHTPLSKKIILQNCDKSRILTNREVVQAADRVGVPRREAQVEMYYDNNNKSHTLRETELSAGNIKSTGKQIMEDYEQCPTSASDVDSGGHRKSQISGYETAVSSGEEAPILQEENVYSLYVRKGSHRKGTLIHNDTRTHREQKLFSGLRQNKQSSGMKEKSRSCYGRGKNFEKCYTNASLRRDTFSFSDKKIAVSRRKENVIMKRTRLLFSDSEPSTSGDTRNTEEYNRSRPVSSKEKPVPSVSNTLVSGAEMRVENIYTRPFGRTEDALLPTTEINLGYSDGGQIVKKNKLETVDREIFSTLQDKLLMEAEESIDCERRSPVSVSKQFCGHSTASKSVQSCREIERQENLSSDTSDEDCVEESVEDASTVIIHPLLSYKYEHEVSKIRRQLNNLHEILKAEGRGPMAIHDDKRPSCKCSCTKRRSVFTERGNKRCKLSLDMEHEQLSHVSETLSQTEDAKYYEYLGSGNDSVSKTELSSDKREDAHDTKSENVLQCTSLQSDKVKDKINSSGSQTIPRRNDSSEESSGRLVTSLELGTNRIKYSHCNFDDFKMDSKRSRELSMSNSAVGSVHDGNDGETTDDDDDIFHYRCPQNSSLNCEIAKQINRQTVCLDPQSKSARSASAKISEFPVAPKHRPDDRRVFSDNGDHRVTETPHFVTGGEQDGTEHSATGNGGNARQRRMKTEQRSKRDENDSKSLKTKSKRKATTLKHLVGSKYEENGCNASDDSDGQKNGNILHRQRRRSDLPYCLIASDHDKGESCISDDELPNMENVLTGLKRQMKSSNSSVRSKHNITEDVSGDGENSNKENVPSRRENRMKMCSSSEGPKYGHMAHDGNIPEKENVLKRRERGTERCHSVASEYEQSDDTSTLFDSDAADTSNKESLFITGMPNAPQKRSLLCRTEERKTSNSLNENRTSLKSGRTNKYESVTNNSSQIMSTRKNILRESLKHSVKSAVCRNETTGNSDNSSGGKSAGTGFLTDSHGEQLSEDIMPKLNCSQDIHKTDSKLMKNSRRKTRKVSTVGSEQTETDDDDDIFYRTPRKSLFCGKEMGRVNGICGNESLTCFKSNKATKSSSSQNLSSRESETFSCNSLVFTNGNASAEASGKEQEGVGSGKSEMEFSLTKSSRTDTHKDNSASSEHLEEKLLQHEEDDIFYCRTPKQ